MTLTALDWLWLAVTLLTPLAVGVLRSRLSGRNLLHFFLAGRELPWWLAGTSMVATTFAADTPLAVTGLVAAYGIAGNWLWWNAALGSMLTVAFFARLWQRAGILTDIELVELRYAGRSAATLRALRAVYLGLPINCLIIGWVNLAMAKVLSVALGWNELTAVLVGLAVTGTYASVTGLRGVVVADFIQFVTAIVGASALAYFVLRTPEVGGIPGLIDALPPSTFRIFPVVSTGNEADVPVALTLPLSAFVAYLGVQWWASWYPGQEPGGGGYVAQRMMATRGERDALLATLWFTVAHYCVRPWPWILVALASLVLYPGLSDPESGYVMAIRDHLPIGWRGFVIGSFFAAYMSTVSTQLNWGTSYLVNDGYKRFVRPNASDGHLVAVARVATLLIMTLSAGVTFALDSIRQAWEFMLESGAGIGLVLIMRWYWWRVTAVSEIVAIIASAVGFLWIRFFTDLQFPQSLLYLVPWTTICWLVATFITPPEPMDRLASFYRRVTPAGPGWRPVAATQSTVAREAIWPLAGPWFAGCIVVYTGLAGTHSLLFGSWHAGVVLMLCSVGIGLWLVRELWRERDV